MADLIPRLAQNENHEDYAALAVTAMGASGGTFTGETWSQSDLSRALYAHEDPTLRALWLLHTKGWIEPAVLEEIRGRPNRPSSKQSRPANAWRPTTALYDTARVVNNELLQAPDEISHPYLRAVRAHIRFETAESIADRDIGRARRLQDVKTLAALDERPSGAWLAGALAWDALVQVIAYNCDWMKTDHGVAIWRQHILEV